jgi:hypothetical protein
MVKSGSYFNRLPFYIQVAYMDDNDRAMIRSLFNLVGAHAEG